MSLPLLVVCGPTASGKTRLAISLAKAFDGEIVSADSMQIYRRMDIGTAKPDLAEREGVPHHLLDIVEPGERFSVARYVEMATAVIADIHRRGKLPVVAGGTGLYIDSLVNNIQFGEIKEDLALRAELSQLAQDKGNQALWEMLHDCDPALADKLHPNNLGRVIRGIEVYRVTGTTLTQWQERSRTTPSQYDVCMVGLTFGDREKLYQRIDQRVSLMLENGLLDEVNTLLADGFSLTAGQAIGYKELFAHCRGELSLAEAAESIRRETRRYAKRQLTWLRREQRIHWLQADAYDTYDQLLDQAAALVDSHLKRGTS